MDEQNYGNGQNGGDSNNFSQNQPVQSENYYQDYTSATQQYQAPDQNDDGPRKANGMQIASLVLGIIGIPGCCCYGVVGLLFGIIGLVLALVGNKQNKGSGIGIGGLVCSVISIFFGIFATIYFALFLMGMAGVGPLAEFVEEYMKYYDYPF